MPIMGGGNTDSLSMSGNTGQVQVSVLGQVPTKASAPTNYLNLIDIFGVFMSNIDTSGFRVCLAKRELNAVSEDPGAFGGINSLNDIGATIAIRPLAANFPSVKSFAKSRVRIISQTSHPVILPFGIQIGDLLLAIIVTDDNGTISTPSGWTSLFEIETATICLKCVYRVADGSEGSSISFITQFAFQSAHISLRIGDYQGNPEATTNIAGEPPSLTPSWGANNTLWLAIQAGVPMTDQAIINGPEGSIYGYYDWINRGAGRGNTFFYADQRLSPYKDRNYYTSASSPNPLVFPNTSLSINDFYDTSPIDEWSLSTGGGGGK